jgi:hypothetical protein
VHSPDPILGAEAQKALEVAVVMMVEVMVVGGNYDKCLRAMET